MKHIQHELLSDVVQNGHTTASGRPSGVLIFQEKPQPNKEGHKYSKCVFFLKVRFENGNSVRPNKGSQHAPRKMRCKYFSSVFFFSKCMGSFSKMHLGVSLKNMNITREMRKHNIEYGLVSFTVRHSTSEKYFYEHLQREARHLMKCTISLVIYSLIAPLVHGNSGRATAARLREPLCTVRCTSRRLPLNCDRKTHTHTTPHTNHQMMHPETSLTYLEVTCPQKTYTRPISSRIF